MAGATAFLGSGGGWVPFEDEDGDGAIHLPRGGPVVVRHAEYSPAELRLDGGIRERSVVLTHGGAMAGIVHGVEGTDCTVSARFASDPPERHMEDLQESHPRLLSAVCAEDGTFVIHGLLPGRRYMVEAASRNGATGWVEATAGTSETPSWVELDWLELWGSQVVFVGPGGADLECPEGIDIARSRPASHFAPRLPVGFRHAGAISGRAERSLTGGVRPGLRGGRYRAVILMTPEGSSPAVREVPVTFTFQLPGHEPVQGETLIRPLDEEPHEIQVELVPRGAGFGSLIVEFHGSGYLEGLDPRAWLPEHQLRLEEDSGDVVELSLAGPLTGSRRLDGIPAGDYAVSLKSFGKENRIRPDVERVRVGEDATPRVAFELGVLGSIKVVLLEPDGRPYERGPLAVQLLTETEPGRGLPSHYHLPGPPYVLRHVPPGPHWLWLVHPTELRYRDADAVPLDTVLVTESTVSRVVLSLAEGPPEGSR